MIDTSLMTCTALTDSFLLFQIPHTPTQQSRDYLTTNLKYLNLIKLYVNINTANQTDGNRRKHLFSTPK